MQKINQWYGCDRADKHMDRRTLPCALSPCSASFAVDNNHPLWPTEAPCNQKKRKTHLAHALYISKESFHKIKCAFHKYLKPYSLQYNRPSNTTALSYF